MAGDEIVIHSEDDAWQILSELCDGNRTVPPTGALVTFRGWPKLSIKIPVTKKKSSISSSMMEQLIEVQKQIFRAYALVNEGTSDTRKVNHFEREKLEINVVVKGGSSIYNIDLQSIFQSIANQVVDKMEPVQIVIVILSVALMYFGKVTLQSYLDHRLNIRKEENKTKDGEKLLDGIKFLSDKETERMRILADALSKAPILGPVAEEAEDVHHSLLKAMTTSPKTEVQGITMNGDVAAELATNARRTGEDVRLDGNYKILRVDTTHPDGFMVRLENVEIGTILSAGVQNIILSEDHRKIIREAEWQKKPIKCEIEARKVGGQITRATITNVENIGK